MVTNVIGGESLKIFSCACPDTKNARDICLLQSAEGEIACKDLIEAHKKSELFHRDLYLTNDPRCMSAYGFKV